MSARRIPGKPEERPARNSKLRRDRRDERALNQSERELWSTRWGGGLSSTNQEERLKRKFFGTARPQSDAQPDAQPPTLLAVRMVTVCADQEAPAASESLRPVLKSATEASVNAAYKKKSQKVQPVNQDEPSGETPGGTSLWEERAIEREKKLGVNDPIKWDDFIHPKVSAMPRGTRLTPERAAAVTTGVELSPEERDLLLTMLSNREAAIAWEFCEIGSVHPDVAPPQSIRVVDHEPFQARNFQIPKALQAEAIRMLQERIDRGLLEECHGPYRNPWFLVAKGNGKYRLINAAIEMKALETLVSTNQLEIKIEGIVKRGEEKSQGIVAGGEYDIFESVHDLQNANSAQHRAQNLLSKPEHLQQAPQPQAGAHARGNQKAGEQPNDQQLCAQHLSFPQDRHLAHRTQALPLRSPKRPSLPCAIDPLPRQLAEPESTQNDVQLTAVSSASRAARKRIAKR